MLTPRIAVGPRYNKPVWVSEFRGSGTPAQELNFINTMIPWLAGQASVERYVLCRLLAMASRLMRTSYAYFADIQGILVNNGQLTALGQAYATD
jgi:hypothetical protein